jgi:lipoprotein-anchoring transpeptidase ErfK/SrfK
VPPADVRADNPKLPDIIPGGDPRNPMGAAAITLSGDKYAIHGTNRPDSIGRRVSYGCFRMLNEDVTDLFQRVSVGAPVVVER